MRVQFAVIPTYAIEHCSSPDSLALLTLIAAHTDQDGTCRATYKDFGTYLNRSSGWIAGAVRTLKQAGLVVTTKVGSGQHITVVLEPNSHTPFVQPVDQRAPPRLRPAEQEHTENRSDPPSYVQRAKEAPTTTESINNEQSKKKKRAGNKQPISPDWNPGKELREWAAKARPDLLDDLDDIISDFRYYWIESGESRASWSLTFKNWTRRESPRTSVVVGSDGRAGKIDRNDSRSRIAAVASARLARRG